MRVIFVTHNYPRFPGDAAGGFLHPLATSLKALGHDVRVVAPSDQGRGGRDLLDGIPVRRVRYASPARERYAYRGTMQSALHSPAGVAALVRLRRALRRGALAEAENAPAVVHAHWWIPGGWAAPGHLPLVLTVHGTDGRLLERSAVARLVGRPIIRRARIVTAVSGSLAASLRHTCGLHEVKIQPMPRTPEEVPWSEGGGGLLLVTRFTAQKRVGLVLNALALLKDRGILLPTIIAGDGPEREALESQASAMRLPVTFTGALPFREVRLLLRRADLAVQPSVAEGFGLAAAEAIMAGIPTVVCHDGGGLLDIVPPDGAGRQVAPDAGEVARALEALLGNPGAREAARALGASWRQKLDPDAVAARFAEWYQEALHG